MKNILPPRKTNCLVRKVYYFYCFSITVQEIRLSEFENKLQMFMYCYAGYLYIIQLKI